MLPFDGFFGLGLTGGNLTACHTNHARSRQWDSDAGNRTARLTHVRATGCFRSGFEVCSRVGRSKRWSGSRDGGRGESGGCGRTQAGRATRASTAKASCFESAPKKPIPRAAFAPRRLSALYAALRPRAAVHPAHAFTPGPSLPPLTPGAAVVLPAPPSQSRTGWSRF